jgi:hypothetical protein
MYGRIGKNCGKRAEKAILHRNNFTGPVHCVQGRNGSNIWLCQLQSKRLHSWFFVTKKADKAKYSLKEQFLANPPLSQMQRSDRNHQ